MKSHGGTTVAYVNGAPQGVIWDDQDNWTAYVSPYMVVNGDRFTKHYYIGSQRIASKIGVGDFNNLYDASKSCVTAGQKDYAERVSLITQSRDDYNAALGIAPGPPTAKGIYGEAEYSGAYGSYSIKPLGNYDVPLGWPSKPYKRPYGGTPGAPVMYQKPSDPDETGAGYGYSNAEGLSENDVYFYHSDHLGSTSYITDKDGNAVQYIAYKPFGETLIDEHAVSYDSPWKFNGKEWDSETGLYYYGARYYEPALAIWYGVDALAEKYPSVGGYVYCVGNPVKFVDPDGKEIFILNTKGERIKYSVGMKYHDEKDTFVQNVINYLDAMSEVEAGNTVLTELCATEMKIDFVNKPSNAGPRSFQFLKYKGDVGGCIRASAFLYSNLEDAPKVEGAAHELFHAFQFVKGRNFYSSNAEVEAFLFGNGIAANSKYGSEFYMYIEGNSSEAGVIYGDAMLNLSTTNLSTDDFNWYFNSASENFVEGNLSSYTGKYRNVVDKNYEPLIKDLLPLR